MGRQWLLMYNSNNSTTVRTSGNDDVFNNADDILTTYCFDYAGNNFLTYSTNTDKTKIYGTQGATYQNSDKVSTQNNLTNLSSVGLVNSNEMINTGGERPVNETFLEYNSLFDDYLNFLNFNLHHSGE